MFCLKFLWGKSTTSEQCPPPPPIVDTRPTIMDMPYLVMKEILDRSDFLTILILRRVCRDFRHFIDIYNPPWSIERFIVWVGRKDVEVLVNLRELKKPKRIITRRIEYNKEEDGVRVIERTKGFDILKEILLKNENFVDAYIHDFSWILQQQKRPLKWLRMEPDEYRKYKPANRPIPFCCFKWRKKELNYRSNHKYVQPFVRRIIDSWGTALASRSTPLQLETLLIGVFEQPQLRRILENVDLASMQCLAVKCLYDLDEVDLKEPKLHLMDGLERLEGFKSVGKVFFPEFRLISE